MRFCVLVVVFFISQLTFGIGQTHPPQEKSSATSTADELAGAWRLVSVETTRPNGEVIYPFYGKHPEGMLIYDRSGWMSVQIVSDPKPAVPIGSSRESFLGASPSEKATAIDGYYAYYGTWTVDAGTSTTTDRRFN